VITGANGGLGFQTALELARMGMTVVMACRSIDKARTAQRSLLAEVPGADTRVLPLDVTEPESIREFGRQLSAQLGRLDLLINNAGVVLVPLARNSVGQELHLATNHLGAFALTGTLLPHFSRECPGAHRQRGQPRASFCQARPPRRELGKDPLQRVEGVRAKQAAPAQLHDGTRPAVAPGRQPRHRTGRPSWIRPHERRRGQRRIDPTTHSAAG
jgi:hypothetical protein